jgi:lipopolysaccharide biosynthesis regulator YciM
LAKIGNNPERERTYLTSVLTIAPEYASLVASDILESYRSVGREVQGLELLRDHYMRHPSLDTFNVVFRELRLQQGHGPAWTFAREALRANPSLLGLDRLLEAELASADSADALAESVRAAAAQVAPEGAPAVLTPAAEIVAGADLSLLRSLIHKHTQRLDRYSCRICGFEARHFYWQCPGCNSWETYEPRRLEEMK